MNGLNIYNVLRTLPINLTTHDVGNIDPLAALGFIASPVAAEPHGAGRAAPPTFAQDDPIAEHARKPWRGSGIYDRRSCRTCARRRHSAGGDGGRCGLSEGLLHAIEAERGSVDAYLNTVLGVGPAFRDAILNPHLLAVTMEGNGTGLEFDIELDLVDKTAEIAFRHERDQDIWDPVQTGSEL